MSLAGLYNVSCKEMKVLQNNAHVVLMNLISHNFVQAFKLTLY